MGTKKNPAPSYLEAGFFLWLLPTRQLCVAGGSSFFFDSGLLARKVAQVVQLGAAYFTNLVYFDAVDSRRFQREDTFYANGSRHFAYGETLLFTMAGNFDDNTAVHLLTSSMRHPN